MATDPRDDGSAGPEGPLHAEVAGVGHGPRLTLVHGFTQTRRSWGLVAANLARDHEVVLVDAPGHGRSDDADADLVRGADLLGRTAGRGTYVGYSMGGRLCLHLALARPDLVERLVLLGAHPGIEDADERRQRVREDAERAARLEAVGLAPFLDEWLTQPLFAGLDPEQQGRSHRLENQATALAASLRAAGTGSQTPLWDRLGELEMPVLVLAGQRDGRFAALAERMVGVIGANAVARLVAGAGHAAHLEDPGAFLLTVRRWLDTQR